MVFSHAMNRSVEMALEENEALGQLLDNTSAGRPTRVTVTGCGTNEANGVYTLDPSSRDEPDYVMEGFFEGNEASFYICCLLTGPTDALR